MYSFKPLPFVAGLLFCFSAVSSGQPVITNTGKILYTDNDTLFYVYKPLQGKGYVMPHPLQRILADPDKTWLFNNNNEGWPGQHIFSTGTDSIVFQSAKEQSFLFKVRNNKDTVNIYFSFVNRFPDYTKRYKKNNGGQVTYEIPKGFELTNILIALTDAGKMDDNLVLKDTRYYNEVMNWFKKYDQHPVVGFLNQRLSGDWIIGRYYEARNWGFRYTINNNKIVPQGTYPEQWGQNFWSPTRDLLQDFVQQSNFDAFYKAHQAYYDSLVQAEKKYMPVKRMWSWLEKEFPNRYESYRIIFSPLVNGAHNTERYEANGFSELLVFVCGTERIKAEKPVLIEGAMSGIVFTEIDHNYVNPVSDIYKKEIENIFSDKAKWTGKGGDAGNYGNPMAIFNEYMTHALYCLYADAVFAPADFAVMNMDRERLMIERRKFIRFREFNQELRRLYSAKKEGQTVADLYPAILGWCAKQ